MSTYSDASFIISASGGYKEGDATPTLGKLYNLKPDGATYPSMDVSRGGNAVSQRSDGYYQINWPVNTARFTWDGGVPSILVEKQSQNLIPYPRSFDNAYWGKQGTTIDDNGGVGYPCPFVDSSGVNTNEAYKLINNSDNTVHYVNYIPIYGSSIKTQSIWVKSGELTKVALEESGVNGYYCSFDLITGTVIASNGITNYSIKKINDWYKLSITLAITSRYDFSIVALDDNYTNGEPVLYAYTGDGTSGIYICHAQLEEGTVATSPIYGTEGSALTRLADNIQVDLPVGVTEVQLTDKDDVVTTDSSPADPYVIPESEWKKIIML